MSWQLHAADNPLVPTTGEAITSAVVMGLGLLLAALLLGLVIFLARRSWRRGHRGDPPTSPEAAAKDPFLRRPR